MTIVFQGHVKSLETASDGKLAATLVAPMAEADGKEWVVFIPYADCQHWMPGRIVNFTLYTLPEPS